MYVIIQYSSCYMYVTIQHHYLGYNERHFLLGVALSETATRAEAERHERELVTQTVLGRGAAVAQPALGFEAVGHRDEFGATRRYAVVVQHARLYGAENTITLTFDHSKPSADY